jgi:hypothetical protein
MYLASYRRHASHSWRYRRLKPFASWPGSISAAWGSYGMEETRRRGGRMLCGEDAQQWRRERIL